MGQSTGTLEESRQTIGHVPTVITMTTGPDLPIHRPHPYRTHFRPIIRQSPSGNRIRGITS